MASWMKARQTRYTAYVSVYIIVIVAILSAVNFLSNRYDKSYDSTANKQFSLSEQTTKVVKNLKNNVTVSYFGDTANFPQARDLLGRYSALSPKLKVDYVDPVKKPQLARAAGVHDMGTIVVDSGTRKEEAKALTEEDITGALVRAVKGGQRTACFLSGSGEHSLDDTGNNGFSDLKDALGHDNYKTQTVNLSTAAPLAPGAAPVIGQVTPAHVEIPKDCSVLVAGGPKLAYSAAEVAAIKTYVESGGRALIMLDTPLRIGQQEGAQNPDLVKLLADWGVTADDDLALDTSGVGSIFGLGPEVAVIAAYEDQPIVRDFKEGTPTAIPLARTLKIAGTPKTTVNKLLATTENSVAIDNAIGKIDPNKGVKGPLVLAATGSYNTGNPSKPGRFVVYGSSIWAVNSLLGSRSIANRDLALNTFNWLSSDEDLISIHPKEPEDRPLNIRGNQMSLVFWWSVVLIPASMVGFGLMVWWRRR